MFHLYIITLYNYFVNLLLFISKEDSSNKKSQVIEITWLMKYFYNISNVFIILCIITFVKDKELVIFID